MIKPCLFQYHWLRPSLLQLITEICSSSVLPDYCVIYRFAGFPVPHNGSLPLVGYSYRCNITT